MQGREEEFNLLNNLGFYKTKIKLMLMIEVFIIGTLSVIVGSILSTIGAHIFMSNYNIFTEPKIYGEVYINTQMGIIGALFYIIHINLNKLRIGIYDLGVKEVYNLRKKQAKSKTILMLIGLFIAFDCRADIGYIGHTAFGDNWMAVKTVIYWTAIFISLDGIIYWMFRVLEYISKVLKLKSLYLAIEQNIYSFKRINTIISSLMIAVIMLIGMKGVFESVRETTKKYVNESINYDYMVIMNEFPDISENQFKEKLQKIEKEDSLNSIGLNIILKDENNKQLRVTGIDESYNKMQRLYMLDETGNEHEIYEDSENLNLLIPSNKAKDKEWSLGDTINEYQFEGRIIGLNVSKIYKPLDLTQAFTSKTLLSKKIFQRDDIYNTVYLKNYKYEDIEKILNEINCMDYTISDMDTIRTQSMDQMIQGTELIEMLMYIILFLTASLIVNIFILSINDRKKQNVRLLVVGVSREVLISSMLIESTIIFAVASVIGWKFAIRFVEGGLRLLEKQLIFETVLYIPNTMLPITLAICYIGLMICTAFIEIQSFKDDLLKYNYKD